MAALDVKFSTDQLAKLNALSEPQLNFPAPFLSRTSSFMHGGITVNGDSAAPSPFAPKADSKTY